MTYLKKVKIDTDTGASDAFGRLRISEAHTIFDSKLIGIDDGPLFWQESAVAGDDIVASTPSAAKPYVDLVYTADDPVAANTFTRQTYRRFSYQPGKGQLILMTGVLKLTTGDVATGLERRIGAFDDNNGLFFEDNAGTVGVTVRTNDSGSPVDTTVAQSSWNIDKMDGTGPSGVTADWTKAQIFTFDFQWLGVGRVRFGLWYNGVVYPVHQVNQANSAAIPWASTPNLPLRYQMITTSGSSDNASMRCICAAVMSEAGLEEGVGVDRYYSTAGTQITCATEDVLYAVCGLQLKTTHLGANVHIHKVNITLQSASDDIEWVLVFNPSLSGSPGWTNVTNGATQTLNPGSHQVTNGTQITGGYVSTGAGSAASESSAGQEPDNALRLGAQIDGTVQTIILAARAINGTTNALVEGSISWHEYL